MQETGNITRLLQQWQQGDKQAEAELISLVREELRQLVHRHLNRESNRHLTPQTTEMFHELYLRLVQQNHGIEWKDRNQFFAFSSRLLRQVLVDAFRERHAQKRGKGMPDVLFDPNLILHGNRKVDLMQLEDALCDFEKIDPDKSRVVELRFFGGLTVEETAEALRLSTPTVKRYWRIARTWLLHYLQSHLEPESQP